jgi:hypothetical protein
MTKLLNKNYSDQDELLELLIKNLPSTIKGGNEKHLSNIYDYPTITALKKCKFINFNSRQRISFIVFDIDKVGDMTALEHFKTIEGFLDFLAEKIGLEPTFITQTTKGFHFAYHLKNHVYTFQDKAVKYLKNIKRSISALIGCDEIASNRLNGIWRNPLKHQHYYSGQINYELIDFSGLVKYQSPIQRGASKTITINQDELIDGNRNNALFKYAMRYAKGKTALSPSILTNALIEANAKGSAPLDVNELYAIASSVYKYWCEDKISFGVLAPQERNINEGIMNFPKMEFLPYEDYVAETKRRQSLSAQRTNAIKNERLASIQLQEAREKAIQSKQQKSQEKIADAVKKLEDTGEKITVSAVEKITRMSRETIKKYLDIVYN